MAAQKSQAPCQARGDGRCRGNDLTCQRPHFCKMPPIEVFPDHVRSTHAPLTLSLTKGCARRTAVVGANSQLTAFDCLPAADALGRLGQARDGHSIGVTRQNETILTYAASNTFRPGRTFILWLRFVPRDRSFTVSINTHSLVAAWGVSDSIM